MDLRHRTRSIALLIALASAPASAADVESLVGSWGLPPKDDGVGLTGSFLSVSRDGGAPRVGASLNPQGWSCSFDVSPTWNAGAGRLEWPNRREGGADKPCWMSGARQDDRLDLSVWCPYECTDAENVHHVVLDRLSDRPLKAPDRVVSTFCARHDALAQELCQPGDLQPLIASANDAALALASLGDGDERWPNAEQDLLDVMARCHMVRGDRHCLEITLKSRLDSLQESVATRRRFLEKERRDSEAAAVTIADGAAQEWAGKWHLVTDQILGSVTVERCEASGCAVSLDGVTNYTFGYQERSGECMLDQLSLRFLGPERAFAYMEPDDRDAGDGPFSNFCRLDFRRSESALAVGVRGVGCSALCTNAHANALPGDYHRLQTPGFTCSADLGQRPWDEQNICMDPELSSLDRSLASAFAKAKAKAKGASQTALVRAQRAWLAKRRDTCNADKRRTCLVEAYRRRLEELDKK